MSKKAENQTSQILTVRVNNSLLQHINEVEKGLHLLIVWPRFLSSPELSEEDKTSKKFSLEGHGFDCFSTLKKEGYTNQDIINAALLCMKNENEEF